MISFQSQVRAVPQKDVSWRGIHVLVHNDDETRTLSHEIPRLSMMGMNVLVVEVDYNYAYESHPELRGHNPMTKDRASVLAETCRSHGIRPIPFSVLDTSHGLKSLIHS